MLLYHTETKPKFTGAKVYRSLNIFRYHISNKMGLFRENTENWDFVFKDKLLICTVTASEIKSAFLRITSLIALCKNTHLKRTYKLIPSIPCHCWSVTSLQTNCIMAERKDPTSGYHSIALLFTLFIILVQQIKKLARGGAKTQAAMI